MRPRAEVLGCGVFREEFLTVVEAAGVDLDKEALAAGAVGAGLGLPGEALFVGEPLPGPGGEADAGIPGPLVGATGWAAARLARVARHNGAGSTTRDAGSQRDSRIPRGLCSGGMRISLAVCILSENPNC